MKTYKLILSIALSVLLFQGIHAQESGPDAIFLNVNKEYRLDPDGSMYYHYSHRLKLLTYFAIQRQYGETSVTYDPRYQHVKLIKAFTTNPDGKEIQVPVNGIIEVLPDFASNAPSYNYLRRLVIVHTGLELNSVINVEYEVYTKSGYFPALMGNESLPGYSPIQNENISIKIPKGTPLSYKLLHSKLKPVITTEGDTTLYTWSFASIGAVVPEAQMPPASYYLPCLLFSTAANLNQVCNKFMSQDAFHPVDDEQLKNFVVQLKNNSRDELDFILKLQKAVAVDMKTYNIPLNYNGYKINSPLNVFHTNGGTTLEKAVLMSRLLSYVNIPSVPVLLATDSLVNPEAGNLSVFSDALIRVYSDPEKYIYFPLDKTVSQNLKFNLNGKILLPLVPDSKNTELVTENNHVNSVIFKADLKLTKEDEISGSSELITTGAINPYFLLYQDSTHELSSLIDGVSLVKDKKSYIRSEMPYQSISDLEISLDPSHITHQQEYTFVQLPGFNDGFDSWHIQAMNTTRINPFLIPCPLQEAYFVTITLPKNSVLESKVSQTEIKNDQGKVSVVISKSGRNIMIYRELVLKNKLVYPADYGNLKELIDLWLDKNLKSVILKTVAN